MVKNSVKLNLSSTSVTQTLVPLLRENDSVFYIFFRDILHGYKHISKHAFSLL